MLGSHVQAPQLLPQGRGPVRVLSYARSLVIGAPLSEEDVGTPPGKRPADGRADSGSPARACDDGHAPPQPFFRIPALFGHRFSSGVRRFTALLSPDWSGFPLGHFYSPGCRETQFSETNFRHEFFSETRCSRIPAQPRSGTLA